VARNQMESVLAKVEARLPRKLVYPRVYHRVYALQAMRAKGEDVQPYLRRRLAELLQDALQCVPYYMDLNLGIDPRTINPANAFDVLKQFPFISKRDIMASPIRLVSRKYRVRKLKMGTSGGSTGEGIKIYRNTTQQLIERCFFDYTWHTRTGWKRSSRMVRIGCGGIRTANEHPCSRYANRLLISPYHMSARWIAEIFLEVERFEPEYFHSYPSSFEYLLSYMRAAGLRLAGIKGIFLASERITRSCLEAIREVFPGVPVVFHYGLSERTNLAWGLYAGGHISYVCDDVYGFSENTTDEYGRHEIAGTSYWNDVMPLVRYRTQDYGLIEDSVIKELDGREQEFLVTKNGDRIPGFTICIDMFTWDFVETFQVVQNEKGKLEFHVVPRQALSDTDTQRIALAQDARWGRLFDIRIVLKDKIDRTNAGKQRLVVSNLGLQEGERGCE